MRLYKMYSSIGRSALELSQQPSKAEWVAPTSFVILSSPTFNVELFLIYDHATLSVKSYIHKFYRFAPNRRSCFRRVPAPPRAAAILTARPIHALREQDLRATTPSSRIQAMAPKYSLSDSESEAEADVPKFPSDAVLEQALRDEVAAVFKSGNMEELTVKRVRLATEKKLGLEEGFFKTTGDWKTRSDEIIKDEVVRPQQLHQCDGHGLTVNGYLGSTRQLSSGHQNKHCQIISVSSTTAQENCRAQASEE